MVVFHSYVCLPEGTVSFPNWHVDMVMWQLFRNSEVCQLKLPWTNTTLLLTVPSLYIHGFKRVSPRNAAKQIKIIVKGPTIVCLISTMGLSKKRASPDPLSTIIIFHINLVIWLGKGSIFRYTPTTLLFVYPVAYPQKKIMKCANLLGFIQHLLVQPASISHDTSILNIHQ